MKKLVKIFSLIMTVCLLCGIIAVAVSASAPNAGSSNQLVIPAVTDENGVLISGNYAYNDGTNLNGWSYGNGGGPGLTTCDTSKGYINFRHKVTTTTAKNTAPYVEWDLSTGYHDTNGMYKMNLRNYSYAVVDFDYGTDSYRMQIGYHVNPVSKYTWKDEGGNSQSKDIAIIEPMYKTFVEITDAEIQAAIDANYETLKADLLKYKEKFLDDVDLNPESYKWTLEEAKPTKTLAFVDGSHVYLIMRSMTSLTLDDYSKGTRKDHYLDVYTNVDKYGNWYLCDAASLSASKAKIKVEDINDFKHVTMVIKTTATTDTTSAFQLAVYLDGVFMYEKTFSASASYVALYLDGLRQDVSNSAKLSDSYSLGFDNLSVNYYAKGYNTPDTLGVDDLFGEDNKIKQDVRLYNLTDTIYNKDFKALNGAVTIGDVTYNVPELAYAAIESLTESATITSTMPLFNLDIAKSVGTLTINTTEKVTFTDAALVNRVAEVTDSAVILRAPKSDEKVPLNWLDSKGNVITKTDAIYGRMPESGLDLTLAADYVDPATGILYDTTITGWKLVIDGAEVDLRALTKEEVGQYKSIDVIPVCDAFDSSVTLAYYIGKYDADARIVRPYYDRSGSYDAFKDASTLQVQFYYAKDDSTLVLLSDIEIRSQGTLIVHEYMTQSFDLNGHDISWLQGSRATGVKAFQLAEGSTLNVYSSRAGGRIFHAVPYYKGAPNYTDYQFHAQNGFVTIPQAIDAVNVTIGAFRGYEANLEYNGGCVVYSHGYDFGDAATTVDRDTNVGGGKRIINVNGGNYYFIARPPYGAFATTAPDTCFNVTGASFYSVSATYSVFHDYGSSTTDTRFVVNTTYRISDCDFLGLNLDSKSHEYYSSKGVLQANPISGKIGAWTKVFYELAADSVAYIDNCNIVAQLYHNFNGKIYFGEGNVVATNSDLAKVRILDGVTALKPATNAATAALGNLSLSFSHAQIYNNFDEVLVLVEGQTNNYVLIDGVLDRDYSTVTGEKPISIVTVKDSIPSAVAGKVVPITWYDPSGNVYATTYDIVGNIITPVSTKNLPVTELNNGWYDLGYNSWSNATNGEAKDSFVAVAGKDNKFTPNVGLVGDIDGVKAKFDISTIEYVPLLYVPRAGIADAGVIFDPTATSGDAAVTGFYFNGTRGGVASTMDGVSYYRYSTYLGHSEIAGRVITVIFIVPEYDINGDGTITDDEKNIQVTDRFLLSSAEYATAIIKQFAHGSDEANLAYEMIRYDDVFSTYVGSLDSKKGINTFYEIYAAACNCTGECKHIQDLDKLELKNLDGDISELAKYVYGATYSITAKQNKPRPYLYLLPLAEGESYTVSVKGYEYDANGKLKEKIYSAQYNSDKNQSVQIGEQTLTVLAYEIKGLLFTYLTDYIYVTITHTAADGTKTTVSGEYSLGMYVQQENSVEVVKALYSFSLAARDYKLVTRDEVN